MIRLRQVKVNDKNSLEKKLTKILNTKILEYKIVKESIDARNKNNILFTYEVDVKVENEEKYLNKNKDIFKTPNEEYKVEIIGKEKLDNRPVIIGSGPSGLFCAYMLALYNYKPIIIERGEDIDNRVKTVEEFWKNNNLNTNSNVQFGEGGAGTFSDGKLNTLVKDKENRCKKVFEIFVENGAPEEIIYKNKPHIGTDLLRNIIKNMRNTIIKNGGEFRYNTLLTDINITDKINSIKINNEILNTDILVLGLGHSARDTFEMLYNKGIKMEPKSFAVGIRIEHPQKMINYNQFGNNVVEQASYKLTYKCKDRGVYSFCMCPGGYVVNASSEKNMLVINGMSNYKRDTENANSAIVVSVNPNDYGNNLFDGIKFQRELESKAYNLCNGKIPVQLYKDFVNNKKSEQFGKYLPIVKGSYELSNLNDILPSFISASIKEAMPHFGKIIEGFDRDDTILLGIESRTSSPIRILRNDDMESNIKGIYPIGEGAGYAGGITTSAIDGLKAFEKIIKKYKNY